MDGLTAPARMATSETNDRLDSGEDDTGNAEGIRALAGFGRLAALAGIAFVVLDFAADLVVGPFPDGNSSPSTLASFYAAHHAHVAAGGMLYSLAAIPFVFFGAALWARIRRAALHPAVAAVALVGAAIAAVSQLDNGGYFLTLGAVGDKSYLAPAALQSLQLGGSSLGYGGSGGTVILLLAVAIAGIAGRVFPRTLGWTALAFAILLFTPVFFLASLLLNVWIVAASIVLVVRPRPAGEHVR
jgi:hypothetical protein